VSVQFVVLRCLEYYLNQNRKMKYDSIIVGNGEVGSSLAKALTKKKKKSIKTIDIKDIDYEKALNSSECTNLHITIPYFNKYFINYCLNYIKAFKPTLVIIHSTVPVGITEEVEKAVEKKIKDRKIFIVHSPVRGQHPKLTESLLYFTKYVGTKNRTAFLEAKKELMPIKVKWIDNSKATELGKLLCTSYYGVIISWHREMMKMCDKFGVGFDDVVTDVNKTYNEGYKKFRPNVIRPTLYPPTGAIGGHCVVPNAKLLNKQFKSTFLELIK